MISIMRINRTIELQEFPNRQIITIYGNNLTNIEPLNIPEGTTLIITINQEAYLDLLFHSKCLLRQLKLTNKYVVIEIVDANNSTA